jgi:UDP-N-acetylglucosamine 1-carboxyvinyltransferase
MDKFIVHGPTKLSGAVQINGAKNAVLPLMAAALLTRAENVIDNVPDLRDVRSFIELLETLGAKVEFKRHRLKIDSSNLTSREAPYDLVRKMRASIYVLGPLVAAHQEAKVSMPGGCAWGPRPIDLHISAMEKLGAKISLDHGYIHAKAKRLKGGEIVFPISSVGASAQVLMAAVLAKGTTTMKNAALEPEVTELANALVGIGARIEGIGTPIMTIEGVDELQPLNYRVIPDRIEAGTFAAAAVATGGKITLEKCEPGHLEAVMDSLGQCGATFKVMEDAIEVRGPSRCNATHVVTREYPGFPTDMQAQMMAVMCRADGVSTIKDTIYPDRFTHVPELRRFGAQIRLDGNMAVIAGVKSLAAAPVMATDIRDSSGLIIAAMAARGKTEILRVYHIDRGYERIERKLRKLGANIKRMS